MLWEGPGLMYPTGSPYQVSCRALLKMNVISEKSVQANSRQLIKMGPGCKMKIQVWPLVSLEASKKFKFYLIAFRFFMVFFCFHPGPWKSEFCFQNKLLWESETIFLDLSFWATCQWYQHLQKETASLALISLVPSAVSLVLVHMLL